MEQAPKYLDSVDTLQLIPDYLGFRLTGTKNCEYTNASTTQLVNCNTGNWDEELLCKLNLNKAWFLDASLPNRIISHYHHSATGHSFPFASIPSHDTASAILAAPIKQPNMAYLSSGTWSLIGIESLTPITHQLAQDFNVTNEGGAEGRFRVLKNIMGLWIIQNVQKELGDYTFADLVSLAEDSEPFKCLINPDDLSFLNPVTMIGAIKDFCAKTHQEIPKTPGELTRCVMESLALQYRKVWTQLNTINGEPLNGIHIVGGGCQNQLLNQMCASACNTTVYVGPVEASTIGNLCGQLIAINELPNVEAARKMVYTSFDIKKINPLNPDAFKEQWDRFMLLSEQL
jgi:rhamnulokinase